MPITAQNPGQSSAANGATVTPANSAGTGRSAFSFTSGTPTQAATGIDLSNGAVGFSGLTAFNTFQVRFCFTLTAAPSATTPIIQAKSGAGGTTGAWAVNFRGDRKFTITDPTGASLGFTSTAVMALDTPLRLDIHGAIAASSTTGSIEVKLYAEGSDTALDTATLNNVNLGSADLTAIRYGKETAATIGLIGRHFAVGNANAFLGEYAAAIADPVIVSAEGTVYKVDVRSSTKDTSDTLAHAIARVSGPTVTADQIVAGRWDIPLGATEGVWRVTTTASPSGKTTTKDFTVPPAANADALIMRVWNGTAWA